MAAGASPSSLALRSSYAGHASPFGLAGFATRSPLSPAALARQPWLASLRERFAGLPSRSSRSERRLVDFPEAYRTLCVAPCPEVREIFERLRSGHFV
jgi:hypothetical protein